MFQFISSTYNANRKGEQIWYRGYNKLRGGEGRGLGSDVFFHFGFQLIAWGHMNFALAVSFSS
jgi:hypothetical protein